MDVNIGFIIPSTVIISKQNFSFFRVMIVIWFLHSFWFYLQSFQVCGHCWVLSADLSFLLYLAANQIGLLFGYLSKNRYSQSHKKLLNIINIKFIRWKSDKSFKFFKKQNSFSVLKSYFNIFTLWAATRLG